MRNHLHSEISLILLICACSLGLGAMIGFPLSGLALGLVGYVVRTLFQMKQLLNWLEDPEAKEPPHLSGILELLLDRSLRANRQHGRESQLLRATLKRQNRLISGVREGVMLVSEKNQVDWFNEQAAELLRLNDKQDFGIPLGNVIRSPSFFTYYEAGKFEEPTLIPAPRNRAQWLEVAITEYEYGDKILVLRDVTRMQRLEQMRTDFIANLSHELRTPLTVLRGYIETLHMQSDLSPSVSRIYDEMGRQSERMAQLLTDLATLSQLENNDKSRNPTPVNVTAMLHRTIKDARLLANYADHVFVEKIAPDFWLKAVENELYSAFSNLVFNAVRHTPAGTEIRISAWKDTQSTYVEISDNGPGIEAKHLPRITERFYRVDASRNMGTGGTGLGLAIVKHAVNAQGGQLDIDSQPGQGVQFLCRFPIQHSCEPPMSKEKAD